MKKRDYLNLLRFHLKELPEVIINDIVYDYEMHFNEGLEKGKTEEEISQELGSPEEIAKEILSSENFGKEKFKRDKNDYGEFESEYNEDGKDKRFPTKLIIIVVALVVFLPILISLFGALFGIIIGAFGVAIAFIATGIAMAVGIFTPGPIVGFGGGLNPITMILISIFLVSSGSLIIRLMVIFVKWLIKSIKDLYYSIRWKRGW